MKRRIVLILLAWVACAPFRAQIGGHVEVEVDELSFTRQDGYDIIRWSCGTDKTQDIGARYCFLECVCARAHKKDQPNFDRSEQVCNFR